MKKAIFTLTLLCLSATVSAQLKVTDFYATPNPAMSGQTFTFHATVVNDSEKNIGSTIRLRGMSDPETGFYDLEEFPVCRYTIECVGSREIKYDFHIITEDERFRFFFRDAEGEVISPNLTVQIGNCGNEAERVEFLMGETYVFVDSVASELVAIYPASAPRDVEWIIGDNSLAEIVGYYADGTCPGIFFKGLAPGETTLTARTSNGLEATIPLTVYKNKKPAESLTLNITEFAGDVGDTFQLEATVEPDDADDPVVYFMSRDEKVATVDFYDGSVELVGEGSTEIISWVWPGSATASCQVMVEPAAALQDISTDETGDVFSIDGTVILRAATPDRIRTLPAGFYIIRYPDRTIKITL